MCDACLHVHAMYIHVFMHMYMYISFMLSFHLFIRLRTLLCLDFGKQILCESMIPDLHTSIFFTLSIECITQAHKCVCKKEVSLRIRLVTLVMYMYL